MNGATKRARELIESVDDSFVRAAIRSAARPLDEPDPLEAWRKRNPAEPEKQDPTRIATRADDRAWVRFYVQQQLESLVEMLGEEVGDIERKILEKVEKKTRPGRVQFRVERDSEGRVMGIDRLDADTADR